MNATACSGLGRFLGHYFEPVYNESREWAPQLVNGEVRVVAHGNSREWMNSERKMVAIVCRRCGARADATA